MMDPLDLLAVKEAANQRLLNNAQPVVNLSSLGAPLDDLTKQLIADQEQKKSDLLKAFALDAGNAGALKPDDQPAPVQTNKGAVHYEPRDSVPEPGEGGKLVDKPGFGNDPYTSYLKSSGQENPDAKVYEVPDKPKFETPPVDPLDRLMKSAAAASRSYQMSPMEQAQALKKQRPELANIPDAQLAQAISEQRITSDKQSQAGAQSQLTNILALRKSDSETNLQGAQAGEAAAKGRESDANAGLAPVTRMEKLVGIQKTSNDLTTKSVDDNLNDDLLKSKPNPSQLATEAQRISDATGAPIGQVKAQMSVRANALGEKALADKLASDDVSIKWASQQETGRHNLAQEAIDADKTANPPSIKEKVDAVQGAKRDLDQVIARAKAYQSGPGGGLSRMVNGVAKKVGANDPEISSLLQEIELAEGKLFPTLGLQAKEISKLPNLIPKATENWDAIIKALENDRQSADNSIAAFGAGVKPNDGLIAE